MNGAKSVVCAVSGGVDSAVAAYLLKRDGFKVTGCFMRNWSRQEEDAKFSGCTIDADEEDARYVCKHLRIPFLSVDFSKSYWNQVFSKFLNEYEQGLTPNPDILCNKYIKFPMLFNYCMSHIKEVDFIATGHYARLKYDTHLHKYRLLKSVDELKDQSFFLSQIEPNLLKNILFPIGDLNKKEVRKIAFDLGLAKVFNKKSSVGICFIGKRNFPSFIDNYLEAKKGDLVDIETNEYLGEHNGIHNFTVGQRVALKDHFNKEKKPYFVAKKEQTNNKIFLAKTNVHPSLYFNKFYIQQPHWICENYEEISDEKKSELILDDTFEFKFQNRHLQTPIVSLRKKLQNNEHRYETEIKHPFRAIAAGQFAVFYKGEECVGSAKITETYKSLFEQNFTGSVLNSDQMFNKKYESNKLKIK